MISTTDFAAVRAFVAVARALSFARAAETLGVSTSAVSQALRGLEDRLGEPLIQRTTRSVSLTRAGVDLFERMAPLLGDMDEGLQGARSSGREPRGMVRLHAFRTAARVHLAPVLQRFARDYPQVTLDITLDDSAIDPFAAGFDAAIRIGEAIQRDLVAVRLGGDLRQIVVASPAYVREHGKPSSPRELLEHRCLLWRWPGTSSPYDWEFAEKGRWFSVRPKGSIIVDDRAFAIDAAVAGAGIAMASEPLVADHLSAGRLVSMLESWCAEYPGFHLCYPQHRTVSRGLRVLIDTLKESA